MIVKPPEQLTALQLERMVDYHQSMAEMYRSHQYPATAEKFDALAEPYRNELRRRDALAPAPKKLEVYHA